MKLRVVAGSAFALLPLLSACGSTAPTPPTSSATQSATAASGGKVQIAETGSSLLYPLWQLWQPAYQAAHPGVQITTGSTGSGTGISDATQGLVQIGSSDAYMSDSQAQASPNLLNIPLAISAQQIMYNLGSLDAGHLHLSGAVLAGIYTGKITYWDNAAITALNPGVKLPHQAIVPVRRSDGSGDTFLFTQYLTDTAGSAWAPGYGTTVTWPNLATEVAANGNQGVVAALHQTPGAIGYVGISWLAPALKDNLGYAAVENRAGQFVLPTASAIAAAVTALAGSTPADERVSLIDAPGATSYPIINFEYAIVSSKQPSAALASALRSLLTWAISPTGGSSATYLNAVSFQPIPASVATLSAAQIQKIAG